MACDVYGDLLGTFIKVRNRNVSSFGVRKREVGLGPRLEGHCKERGRGAKTREVQDAVKSFLPVKLRGLGKVKFMVHSPCNMAKDQVEQEEEYNNNKKIATEA